MTGARALEAGRQRGPWKQDGGASPGGMTAARALAA